jgi:hypothetical protein
MGSSPDAHVRFGIAIDGNDADETRIPAAMRYDGPDTGLSEDELESIQDDIWSWIETTIRGLELDHPDGFAIGTTGSFDYGGYLLYAKSAPSWSVTWSETAALPRELPNLADEYAADFLAIQQALQIEKPRQPAWLLSTICG